MSAGDSLVGKPSFATAKHELYDPAPSPQEAPLPEAVEAVFDRTACSYAIGRKGGLDETYIITRDDFRLLRTALATERKAREDAEKVAERLAEALSTWHKQDADDHGLEPDERMEKNALLATAREAVKGATDE